MDSLLMKIILRRSYGYRKNHTNQTNDREKKKTGVDNVQFLPFEIAKGKCQRIIIQMTFKLLYSVPHRTDKKLSETKIYTQIKENQMKKKK